jgi:hypothetical protein
MICPTSQAKDLRHVGTTGKSVWPRERVKDFSLQCRVKQLLDHVIRLIPISALRQSGVMPALVAGIHVFLSIQNKDVDGRDEARP